MGKLYRIVKSDPKPIRDVYTEAEVAEALATLRHLRQRHGRDAYVLLEVETTDAPAGDTGVAVGVREVSADVDG